ncbi:hypothetical protein ACH4D4_09055 [Streptomyces pristinaespiralis]|uniref:hypothetical protein n=1 Tax=Streptomyces pristinaespiralis TaxID=38300 RepID=UPI0037B6BBEE
MGTPDTSRLTGAVQELASQVVSALAGGDHSEAVCRAAGGPGDEGLGLAAIRVLGSDVLLPAVMSGRSPAAEDLAALEKAVVTFPPAPDAAPTSVWSHWAMTRALLTQGTSAVASSAQVQEPDTVWLDRAPWQLLTHQLAVLGALCVPGTDCGVADAARRRPVDVARGFVRAVRRRDWLQAAGAGRWLAVLDGVPPTLGLDAGLEFVAHMGGTDPRVIMHVRAAQLLRAGARV